MLGVAPVEAQELNYCWFNADNNESKCFSTEAELRQSTTSRASMLNSEYLVAQLYQHAGYRGSYAQIFDSRACSKQVRYKSMPSGWNDAVSSFKVYGGCTVRVWEDGGASGASSNWVGSMSYVGDALNDRISSIQWKKS